jgi:1-acyl-sn-glycerol-3-phosphate acyltransferase
MSLRDELRLLRHGRDWRGRARVPRSAQPWELPEGGDDFPTAWARTAAATALRQALQQGMLKPVVWSQTRPGVHGREYLEGIRGPAIFIANHSSHLDTPLILGALPARITKRLAVGAAADYFFDSRSIAAATTLLFNAFPVERRAGAGGAAAWPLSWSTTAGACCCIRRAAAQWMAGLPRSSSVPPSCAR